METLHRGASREAPAYPYEVKVHGLDGCSEFEPSPLLRRKI